MMLVRMIALALPIALSLPLTMARTAVPLQAGRIVTVRFVNHTNEVRVLYVTTPAGRQLVGTFSKGGSLTVRVPVSNEAAVDVSWEAGSLSGEFTITDDTPGFLKIDLTRNGAVGP